MLLPQRCAGCLAFPPCPVAAAAADYDAGLPTFTAAEIRSARMIGMSLS
jgi:hypothetical protein